MAKKNQKYRKQKQRRDFPWLLVVLGGGLLLLATIVFANRNGAGSTPAISVEQQKTNYGYVRFGETRSIAVNVTNRGEGTLRFKEQPYIEVVEGC